MSILENRGDSDTYGRNSAEELPAGVSFDKNRMEALAGDRFKNSMSVAVMGGLRIVSKGGDVFAPSRRFITLERNLSVTDTPKTLMAVFEGLSKESQDKIWAYVESVKKIEELEKQAKQELESVLVYGETQQDVSSDNFKKRKKRPHAQDTVRRNYSLSEKMANAIQKASQSRGITASLYIEEVMGHQPEVIKSIQVE